MRPDELDDLMQKALDGHATARDQSRLNAALESNPDFRTYFRDLQALFHDLNRLEDLEPPIDLACDISRAVHASGRVRPAARPSLVSTLRTWRVREWIDPSRAFAFALGGALCLAVMVVVDRHTPSDTDSVAGSVSLDRTGTQPTHVIATQRLDFEGGRAQLRTTAGHGTALVEIQLDCADPVALALQTEPGTMTLRGFDRPPGASSAHVDASGVTLTAAGRGRYVFAIESGPGARGFVVVTVGSGAQEMRAKLPVTVGEN